MISYAAAKINIGLHIVGRRKDGYHNIETIFYPFRLYDVIEINKSQSVETSLEITGIDLPVTADNLCLKAYHLLAQDFDMPPVHIHLHKQIPFGAGLGGGSSDASAVLEALNNAFKLGLSTADLSLRAASLGSDCPFFLHNRAMYAEGVGTDLSALDLDLSDKFMVLVKPDVNIATTEAYAGVKPKKAPLDLREVVQLPIQEWKYNLYNDFEEGLFLKYPIIRQAKLALYEQGAIYASMTGSGSAVYGIFDEAVDLHEVQALGAVYTEVEL